jgi:hypothetical protein
MQTRSARSLPPPNRRRALEKEGKAFEDGPKLAEVME